MNIARTNCRFSIDLSNILKRYFLYEDQLYIISLEGCTWGLSMSYILVYLLYILKVETLTHTYRVRLLSSVCF